MDGIDILTLTRAQLIERIHSATRFLSLTRSHGWVKIRLAVADLYNDPSAETQRHLDEIQSIQNVLTMVNFIELELNSDLDDLETDETVTSVVASIADQFGQTVFAELEGLPHTQSEARNLVGQVFLHLTGEEYTPLV